MTKIPATIVIATRNEAVNLRKCLSALGGFERVVVVDSQSTDGTAELAKSLGAEVVQFRYQGGYPKKRQWALAALDIETPWVLLLDADEVVPPELADEIASAVADTRGPVAYLITKGFHFLGRKFRFGGFSHAAVLLFRHGRAKFEHLLDEGRDAPDMEIHERLIVDGPIGQLATPLVHQDFKGLEAYLDRHNRYSTWEAQVRLREMSGGELVAADHNGSAIRANPFGNIQERRRWLKRIAMRTPGEPWLWFVYHYFLRLGILEGKPGLIASRIRGQYISQVRAKLFELQSTRRDEPVDREVSRSRSAPGCFPKTKPVVRG